MPSKDTSDIERVRVHVPGENGALDDSRSMLLAKRDYVKNLHGKILETIPVGEEPKAWKPPK